jgi:hypothetical protein
LEWDRALYVNEGGAVRDEIRHSFGLIGASDDDDRYFAQKMEAIDIWNGGLQGQTVRGLDTRENSFWFAHPAYFINHLNQAGLLDRSFNPYEGRVIKRTWGNTNEERANVVRDNPGFAPAWEAEDARNIDASSRFEGNVFGGYSVPTALFNNRNSATSRHVGVDFRGRSRDTIYSFIYGRVINIGWVLPGAVGLHGNGRILVIANERGRGIYILAHLHQDTETLLLRGTPIQRGLRIEPNDAIALVGASGGVRDENHFDRDRRVPHLHLEYYDVQYEASLDVNENTSSYIRVEGTGADRRLILRDVLTLGGGNRRNPFDHEETQR